jgi:uncharacterized protein GlcG (DUF336 family)
MSRSGLTYFLRAAPFRYYYNLLMTVLVSAATLAAVLLIGLFPRRAVSLPLYARQTGRPCATCHTAFWELTPFGRRFKLGGYTLGGGDWSGPPFAVTLQPGYTHIEVGQPGGAAPHFGPAGQARVVIAIPSRTFMAHVTVFGKVNREIALRWCRQRTHNLLPGRISSMPRSAVANVLSLAVFGLAAGIAPAPVSAQGLLTTHRISAAVASELVAGAVAACKEQTYNVTAVVLDIDGVRQAMLRGDGAGIATLEVANDKAFTSISTRTDTGVLVERAKTTPPSQFLLKVPHMLLLQGAIVIKIGEETVGALGVSGAPGGEKDEACARSALDKISGQLK